MHYFFLYLKKSKIINLSKSYYKKYQKINNNLKKDRFLHCHLFLGCYYLLLLSLFYYYEAVFVLEHYLET